MRLQKFHVRCNVYGEVTMRRSKHQQFSIMILIYGLTTHKTQENYECDLSVNFPKLKSTSENYLLNFGKYVIGSVDTNEDVRMQLYSTIFQNRIWLVLIVGYKTVDHGVLVSL